MRPRLLGPDGKVLNPPTILEVVQEQKMESLLPIIEALSRHNALLQDRPWVEPVGRILDAKGRPYLRVVR